jgi:5'-methylthioadenosine phosphorylase
MSASRVLLLVAVALPPPALEALGPIVAEHTVDTPWGPIGPMAERRHPNGSIFMVQPYFGLPTRVDPRATVWAARQLDTLRVIGWDAGIALHRLLHRGDTLIVDDYIDNTHRQPTTLFENQGVGGIKQVPAFCPQIRAALRNALPNTIDGGVYVAVDGPRRETIAEARLYRMWGGDVIGQNLIPEAVLAKELGLCYAGLLTIVDHAADLPAEPTTGVVRAALRTVMSALPQVAQALAHELTCGCRQAVINLPERHPPR